MMAECCKFPSRSRDHTVQMQLANIDIIVIQSEDYKDQYWPMRRQDSILQICTARHFAMSVRCASAGESLACPGRERVEMSRSRQVWTNQGRTMSDSDQWEAWAQSTLGPNRTREGRGLAKAQWSCIWTLIGCWVSILASDWLAGVFSNKWQVTAHHAILDWELCHLR